LDDVVVAGFEQRRQQPVGEPADHHGTGEKGAEIPRRQAQAERLADAVNPP
jgi:hypothetical protein